MIQEAGGSSPSPRANGPVAQRQSGESNDLAGRTFESCPDHKLYGIGRADLPPGLRAAQIGHALITYVLEHGPPPDNLVLVEVVNLVALETLRSRLMELGVPVIPFYEPDLAGELTALAVGPTGRRYLSSLPLAFKAPSR